MKKVLFFSVLSVFFLVSCGHKYSIDEIKAGIVERETANIPLLVQHIEDVQDITIDSMVITQNAEPYAGYLVTNWTYTLSDIDLLFKDDPDDGPKQMKLLVEVDSIQIEGDSFSWKTKWDRALWDFIKEK